MFSQQEILSVTWPLDAPRQEGPGGFGIFQPSPGTQEEAARLMPSPRRRDEYVVLAPRRVTRRQSEAILRSIAVEQPIQVPEHLGIVGVILVQHAEQARVHLGSI